MPIASYYAKSTPGDAATGWVCFLLGYKVPFGEEILTKLYPTHEAYVKKVSEKVEELVGKRLLTRTDGERIKKEAIQAAVP